jgi:hypothetical protein
VATTGPSLIFGRTRFGVGRPVDWFLNMPRRDGRRPFGGDPGGAAHKHSVPELHLIKLAMVVTDGGDGPQLGTAAGQSQAGPPSATDTTRPGRPSLIGHRDRTRQPCDLGPDPVRRRTQPRLHQLAGHAIDCRRSNRASMHIQTNTRTLEQHRGPPTHVG